MEDSYLDAFMEDHINGGPYYDECYDEYDSFEEEVCEDEGYEDEDYELGEYDDVPNYFDFQEDF